MKITKGTLDFGQDNLKGMATNNYELINFDKNIEMNMRMIEERKKKVNEERQMKISNQIKSQNEKKARQAKKFKKKKH